MLEILKGVWVNYGWSHPYLSSFFAALIGLALWWVFGGVVMLAAPKSPTQDGSSATPPPNVQQSATASNGSIVNQVGGNFNLTVIQLDGRSAESIKASKEKLTQVAIAGMAEFSKRYRHGWLLFGIGENGQPFVYLPQLNDLHISVDWRNLKIEMDQPSKMTIHTPAIHLVYANGDKFYYHDNREHYEFGEGETIEGKPLRCSVPGMYYEIINANENVFLIGFE